jgi:hypothetical protein
VVKLENRAADLERIRDRIQTSEHELGAEADRARNDYGQPFAHTQALADARARSAELATELAEKDQHPGTGGDPATSPAPATRHTSIGTAHSVTPAPSYPTSSGRDWAAQPPRSTDKHAQMASDTAADTFAARLPIQQMDRPSVERVLRHVRGDAAHYTTAQAARDALATARALVDTPAAEPASPEQPDSASGDKQPATPLEVAPPGGWTAADRVQPVSRDTSSYLSAQRYPLGTELAVHAVGEDGPGRRLGHGVVVDHPSPHHVTVESPFGTKRVAPISHVSAGQPEPAPVVGETAAQRWAAVCDSLDARITADPHWPALTAQLERAANTGTDVAVVLAQVTTDNALPEDHPARSLAYRVADVVPDLRSPARMRPPEPDPTARPMTPTPPTPSVAPDTHRPGPRR